MVSSNIVQSFITLQKVDILFMKLNELIIEYALLYRYESYYVIPIGRKKVSKKKQESKEEVCFEVSFLPLLLSSSPPI